MGHYLGVTQVEKIGKPIDVINNSMPKIADDETLVAIISDGMHKIAPDVTEPSEFEQCFESHKRGHWPTFRLYIIKNDQVELCPNEGCVPDNNF